jgi:hypothetical protein
MEKKFENRNALPPRGIAFSADVAVSNPDLPSETSDHYGECKEPATDEAVVAHVCRKREVVFQIRCSRFIVIYLIK